MLFGGGSLYPQVVDKRLQDRQSLEASFLPSALRPCTRCIRLQTKGPKTAVHLITVTGGRTKTVEIAFRPLNLSDQLAFSLTEGTDPISLAYDPDILHLHSSFLFGMPHQTTLSLKRNPVEGQARERLSKKCERLTLR
jgi:hypothetical protein